jgi:hypothetical protein
MAGKYSFLPAINLLGHPVIPAQIVRDISAPTQK